ncbi:MAG: hypothetical protein U0166_10775 [Acidobacteriota bacterium]
MIPRRLPSTLALLAVGLLISACPYSSAVPIDEDGTGTLDPQLLGTWRSDGKDDDGQIAIARWTDREYVLTMTSAKDPVTVMRAYPSDVNGTRLLNVQEIHTDPKSDRSYFLYAYEIGADGRMKLRTVSDTSVKEKFSTSRQLRAYLKSHLKDADLFEDGGTLVREAAR